MPLSVWAGLPAPACAPPGRPAAGRSPPQPPRGSSPSFSRPGDLVVAIDGSPAAAEAAAAAGRVVLGLAPGGPARLLAAGDPGAGTAALAITGCPGPEPDGGGLLYAACERVLRPGGVLAVITASPGAGGPPGDLAGHVVAAARAAGLVYAQHIVLVHAAVDGDRLDPASPAARHRQPARRHPRPLRPAGLHQARRNPPMTSPHPSPPARPAPAGAGLPLSVWATAQRDARAQRRGRYLPASTAHPAKMLPAIAATAIARYTQPGDLVADPMCGIGTTLVEAIHLGRDGLGIEYEPRWAAVAAANISPRPPPRRHRHRRGDPRRRPPAARPAPARHGRAGRAGGHLTALRRAASTARSRAEQRRGGGGVRKYDNRYSHDPANLACQGLDDLLAGFTQILAGCPALLRPGGLAVVTARPWRQHGELVDLPAAVLAAGARAGLIPAARCVALLAGLRGGQLIPRPSFFQLDNIRKARGRGEPWHLIVHEDVLIFRNPFSRHR